MTRLCRESVAAFSVELIKAFASRLLASTVDELAYLPLLVRRAFFVRRDWRLGVRHFVVARVFKLLLLLLLSPGHHWPLLRLRLRLLVLMKQNCGVELLLSILLHRPHMLRP